MTLELRAAARQELEVRKARKDAAAFVEYAIRHERTGKRVVNAPFHREWHEALRSHENVVLMASVEHAKTQQIGVGATLHALGSDPSMRIAIVANSGAQAGKVMGSIRRHIEENEYVREVFPHLRPSQREGDPWHNSAIVVQRPTISKDPSVQAVGVQGRVLGSRLDLIVVDDVLDFETTRTPEGLTKTIQWFDSTILSRLTAGGRVWAIGTPWHPEDLLHELARRPGWFAARYGAVLNPEAPPEEWQPRWPEQFSRQRLKSIHDGMTSLNFARSYLCNARSDESARFQQAWIDAALRLGRGRGLYRRTPVLPSGVEAPCFTGVDLSIGKKSDSDLTAIVTVAVEGGKRLLCDVQAGRWQAPEVLTRLKATYDRFHSIVLVEDNGGQAFLAQWAQQLGIPVRPYTTTAQRKYSEHHGVESMAVELRAGQWIFPSGAQGEDVDPEVRALIREMLFYSPTAHTGDRLMALWLAREAIRNHGQPRGATMDTLSR